MKGYKFNRDKYMTRGIQEELPEVLQVYLWEKMITISLDNKNQPTSVNIVSIGTLNSALCHPREIFKAGVIGNANSIILAHNHPSGDVTPSKEDIAMTEKLVEAGNRSFHMFSVY